ncbi:hypothetical protein BGZ63DRAFT_377441 [Mariannaea sp. PMI_226]|nr:hypothetical protein BGZ63DRAFT_377441 [Mariannaea sp. PMI_226]
MTVVSASYCTLVGLKLELLVIDVCVVYLQFWHPFPLHWNWIVLVIVLCRSLPFPNLRSAVSVFRWLFFNTLYLLPTSLQQPHLL